MRVLLVLTIVAFLALISSPCRAEIPHMVNYQGMLTSDTGDPLNGTYDLNFKIYGSESGNDSLWWEYHTGVQVTDGLFNIILGSISNLDLPFDADYWLGITVGTESELSPRIRITSIAYAYRALVADSAAVAGSVIGSGGGWVDDGEVVRLEDTTDNVCIGMTNSYYKLDVGGQGDTVFAIHGKAPSSGTGVHGESGSGMGVCGYSQDHIGVCGTSLNGYGGFFVGPKNYFSGNVGIGTIDPDDDLHVADHIRVGEDYDYPSVYGELKHDGAGTGFIINANAGGGGWADLHFQTNKTTKMFIESSGKVGIGTTNPAQKLDVNGIVRVRSWGSGTTYDVYVNSNGDLTKGTSSRRYKENIRALEVDPNQALKLSPVRFDWKETGEEDIGLIAEDVEQTLPDLVIYDNEGKPDAVKYDKIAIYLLGVVKDLKSENEELKKRIEALESKE